MTFDEVEEDSNKPMLDYIRTLVGIVDYPTRLGRAYRRYLQALNLVHAPLSAALKSCLLLAPEQYKQLVEVSWQLLLNDDPHVVLTAGRFS